MHIRIKNKIYAYNEKIKCKNILRIYMDGDIL